MSQTFTYVLTDPSGGTVNITVTASATLSDTTGTGPSYAVTAISGSVDGVAIGGEVGAGGVVVNNGQFIYDNAIFTAAANGASGSTDGLDLDGLLFSVNGVDYNLWTKNGSFILANANNPQQTAALTLVSTDAPCFCPGTMISTSRGDVAVETLAIGDNVITTAGETRTVRWIGRRVVSTRFSDPLRVNPIRIKANALADGVPCRDLLVSPDHAILVDGILAQASALVNGVSIIRETKAPEIFTYYHVEVAEHVLIMAENTPAETFIDNVDRMAFDNWDEHEAIVGETSIPEMEYPRAKSSRQLPAATRARLEARAGELFGTATAA